MLLRGKHSTLKGGFRGDRFITGDSYKEPAKPQLSSPCQLSIAPIRHRHELRKKVLLRRGTAQGQCKTADEKKNKKDCVKTSHIGSLPAKVRLVAFL
jgi:hypothetical protein